MRASQSQVERRCEEENMRSAERRTTSDVSARECGRVGPGARRSPRRPPRARPQGDGAMQPQPRMTRNRALVPPDQRGEKRSASKELKKMLKAQQQEVLNRSALRRIVADLRSIKNKWMPDMETRPFAAVLSESEDDTDEEFAFKRAEHREEYKMIIDRASSIFCCLLTTDAGLASQPFRLVSRIKAHPIPPKTKLSPSGDRKLAINDCLFIPGTSLGTHPLASKADTVQ